MNTVKPAVTVVRAIGIEFLRRTLRPLIVVVFAAEAVLLAAGAWLVGNNAWWWVFEALLILAAVVTVIAVVALRLVMRIINPQQSKQQRTAVQDYVDKLQRTAENLQTPYFIIVFRVVKDVLRPRPDRGGFIEDLGRDSKTLAPDFLALMRLFR